MAVLVQSSRVSSPIRTLYTAVTHYTGTVESQVLISIGIDVRLLDPTFNQESLQCAICERDYKF